LCATPPQCARLSRPQIAASAPPERQAPPTGRHTARRCAGGGLARPTEPRHNRITTGRKFAMATLIADPLVEERLIAERRARGADRKDEVWDGVYVIMPDPNVEHQRLVMRLGVVFSEVVNPPA